MWCIEGAFLLVNLSITKQIYNENTTLIRSRCFSGCSRPCLIYAEGAKSTDIEGAYAKSTYIEDIYIRGAYIGDIYSKSTCIRDICIEIIVIKSIYCVRDICNIDTIECLEIYSQSSQILETRLYNIGY